MGSYMQVYKKLARQTILRHIMVTKALLKFKEGVMRIEDPMVFVNP